MGGEAILLQNGKAIRGTWVRKADDVIRITSYNVCYTKLLRTFDHEVNQEIRSSSLATRDERSQARRANLLSYGSAAADAHHSNTYDPPGK